MKGIKKTITSIFIAPTLKIPKEPLLKNGFINAYIKDGEREEQYEDCVYLLFHPDNVDKFREFLDEEYERTKSIIEDYDYEGGFVVVVYKLNPKIKKDFELVKNGQYSKTSKEFQDQFPKSVKIVKDGLRRDEISLQIRVFKKTPDMIEYWENKLGIIFTPEYEVWGALDIEEETLYIEKVKEQYKQKQLKDAQESS